MRLHASDPSPLLEAAFRRIERERMAGLPLLNQALRVQAVGFERWRGHWLGALVTPWFMNLVLVPGDADRWQRAAEGERVFHAFGAGDFAFLAAAEPEVGEFQACSLISPMSQFTDHDSACAAARIALRMLHVEQPAAALVGASTCAPGQTAQPGDAARPSRRTLLFGTDRPAPGPR